MADDTKKGIYGNEVEQSREVEQTKNPMIDTIDKWFVEHFHGSIVSQQTEVYNHVFKAVEELKKRLA